MKFHHHISFSYIFDYVGTETKEKIDEVIARFTLMKPSVISHEIEHLVCPFNEASVKMLKINHKNKYTYISHNMFLS